MSWFRSRILDAVLLFESLVRKTSIEGPVRWLYRRSIKPKLDPHGFYTIELHNDYFRSFRLFLPSDGQGLGKRARLRGRYEPHVMEVLNDHISDSTVFWEIGAQWGYFSMASATRAKRVVAFEKDADAIDCLEKSISRNGFSHVSTVTGTVGENIELNAFSSPDIILMDIEGWEERVLRSSDELLSSHPLLIIEVHDPSMLSPDAPDSDPNAIRTYLSKIGYKTSVIGYNSKKNYHLLAQGP